MGDNNSKFPLKIHLGKCSFCEPNEMILTLCYRSPIKVLIEEQTMPVFDDDYDIKTNGELGKHIDLCLDCITKKFKNRKKELNV